MECWRSRCASLSLTEKMLRGNSKKETCARQLKMTYDGRNMRCIAAVTVYKYHDEESLGDFKLKQTLQNLEVFR